MRNAIKAAKRDKRHPLKKVDETALEIENKERNCESNMRPSDIIRKYHSLKIYYEELADTKEAVKNIERYFNKGF